MTDGAPAVAITRLHVDHPGHPDVLAGIDLALDPGGYTLVSGPTGSGKSTLALALVGALESATRATVDGRVRVHGTEIADAEPAERSRLVAAVWQRPDVQLFRGTVLDEVRSALDYRLVPATEVDARARAALELVGLGDVEEARDPAELSGGQQQRLALAAALAQDATLLVLDEATSALDREAARRFGQALDAVRSERDVTVVAIDHRPDAHEGRVDRLVVLDRGRVVLDGDPETIRTTRRAEVERLGLRLPGATAHDRPTAAGRTLASDRTASDGNVVARLHAASVALRGVAVLHDLTLELPTGSITLVTGDNGSGKTTLLRLLAAELRPTRGRITPRTRRRIAAGIGFAPQRAADLLVTTTVREEVRSALGRGRVDHAEGPDAVAELLERAGLAGLEEQHPLRLSGGQRQRLAVVLAVAAEPELVLVDEPTSAQDLAGAEHVRRLVADGAERRATVIVSHDPATFADLATRHLEIHDGTIREATR